LLGAAVSYLYSFARLSGTLGAVRIPSDDCVWVAYFGRNTESKFWVEADYKAPGMDFMADDEIVMRYKLDAKEISKSELSYKGCRGRKSYTERFVAEVKVTALYNVLIYEISIVVNRVKGEEVTVKDENELEFGMVRDVII
jgi:hypothetical protein